MSVKQRAGLILLAVSVNLMLLGMGAEITSFIIGKFDAGVIWAMIFVLGSGIAFIVGAINLLSEESKR